MAKHDTHVCKLTFISESMEKYTLLILHKQCTSKLKIITHTYIIYLAHTL